MWILIIISTVFCAVTITSGMQTLYMDELCGKTEYISSYPTVRIQLSRSSFFSLDTDCTLELVGGYIYEDQMMIYFTSFDMSFPCDENWLALYDGGDVGKPLINRVCDMPYITYTTSGSKLTLHVKKGGFGYSTFSFEIILTHFKTGFCASYEYRCPNERCIDDDIRCNGLNPCGDDSYACSIGLNTAVIIGIALGSVGFVFVIIAVVVLIVIQRRRRLSARRVPVTFAMSAVTQPQYGQPVMHQQYGQPVMHQQFQMSTDPGAYPYNNTTSVAAPPPVSVSSDPVTVQTDGHAPVGPNVDKS